MAINVVNKDTALLAANLSKEGRTVFFSPVEDFTGIPAGDFADLGYFPADATIAPTSNITRTPVTAQNREGGAPVTLANPVTEIEVTYEIPVLTPDDLVRDLHGGTPATAITTGPLAGTKVSPFNPGASLLGRMIVVSKRGNSNIVRVAWHPRAFLQSNGFGDSQDNDTALFTVSLQAFDYTPGTELSAYDAQITQYGALFSVPREKLQALLDILAEEALPA